MGNLSKAAAILGSFIAVGQTASQTVAGYYQHKIELAKAQQDLDLNKHKSDSALATQFLQIILDKQTADKDRSLLYDALAAIPGHPLQAWALTRHEAIEKGLDQLAQTYQAQLDALRSKDETVGQVRDLEARIESYGVRISLVREDTKQTEDLQAERRKLSEQLARLKATASRAEATVAVKVLSRGGATADAAIASFVLPIDRLRAIFKFGDGERGKHQRENFDRYMPFIGSALVEYGLTDKKMVAAIVATVWYETDSFSTVTEYASGAAYEGRADLGNVEPGDGARFKGRGLLEITGRRNYADYSRKLGLGSRLLDSPDDVNDPDVTSRIMCLFFKERQDQFRQALETNDLTVFRRAISGGVNGLAQFTALYTSTLAVL